MAEFTINTDEALEDYDVENDVDYGDDNQDYDVSDDDVDYDDDQEVDDYEEVPQKVEKHKGHISNQDIVDTLTDHQAEEMAKRSGWHSGGHKSAREWLRNSSTIRDNEAIISLTNTINELKANQTRQIMYAVQQERNNIMGQLQYELNQAVQDGDTERANLVFERQQTIMNQFAQEDYNFQQSQHQQPVPQQRQFTHDDEIAAETYTKSNQWYGSNKSLQNEFNSYFQAQLHSGKSVSESIKLADKAIKSFHPELNGRIPAANRLKSNPNTPKKPSLESSLSQEGKSILVKNLREFEDIFPKGSPEYKSFKSSMVKDLRKNPKYSVRGA